MTIDVPAEVTADGAPERDAWAVDVALAVAEPAPAEALVAEPASSEPGLVEPAAGGRRRLTRVLAVTPLACVIGLYVVHFAEISVTTLRAYGVSAFDFGIFDQGVWLLSRFHDPFVTVMGRNLLGDHSSYVLVLVAPLYWVYPHGATLLVVQALAIGLGAVPVFLVARHFGVGRVIATALAGAYLLNPVAQQVTLEGFHPECFLPLFLGLALYAALTWRRGLLLVMIVLTLLVKEDAGLLVVPIGLWVALRRDRRWGIGIVGAGAAWSIIMPVLVMPAILGYFSTSDEGRMPFGGLSGFVHTLPPAKMFAYLKADGRPFYLWQMLLPTGLAFAAAPEVAGLALFVLAGNYLSPDPYEHQIVYHYSLAPTAILLLGSAFAIGRMRRRWLRPAAASVLFGCSLGASIVWGTMPFSLHPPAVGDPSSPQNRANDALVSMVPPGAVVAADTYFVAHLDHRVDVFLWPTPFHTGNYGPGAAADGTRLASADRVQFLLLDLPQTDANQQVLRSIGTDFRLVKIEGNAALFERSRWPTRSVLSGFRPNFPSRVP